MAITRKRARRAVVTHISDFSEALADFEKYEMQRWRAMELGIAGFLKRVPEDPKTAHLKLEAFQLKDTMRKLRKLDAAIVRQVRKAGAEATGPNVSWNEVSRSLRAQKKLVLQLYRERSRLLERITGKPSRPVARAAKKKTAK
ncbi:MAG: hypothetical protein WCE23_15990 [Candidatus Binatus sp.]|uniref:hypothetical protein n=1 Tax=Candidatus Binatus sp. TaxID=2811406 RepID=UPI003C786BE2